MRMLGQKLSEYMQTETLKNFARESDPVTGQKWKPRKINPKTKWGLSKGKDVRRKVRPKKILVKSTDMKRGTGWKYKVSKGLLRLIGLVSGPAAEKGYPELHQEGKGGMPQRRFLGAGRTNRMRIVNMARKHIKV